MNVKQILEQKKANEEARKAQQAQQRQQCANRNKEHKYEKLKRLIKENGIVCFVAYTPSSQLGNRCQAVMLKDAQVKRSIVDGHYFITGRDIAKEETAQLDNAVRKSYCKRPKYEQQLRSYRVDRIINGTIR